MQIIIQKVRELVGNKPIRVNFKGDQMNEDEMLDFVWLGDEYF